MEAHLADVRRGTLARSLASLAHCKTVVTRKQSWFVIVADVACVDCLPKLIKAIQQWARPCLCCVCCVVWCVLYVQLCSVLWCVAAACYHGTFHNVSLSTHVNFDSVLLSDLDLC